MNATLGELVEFVLKNRKGRAFYGFQEQQIAELIQWAADEGTLFYAHDSSNNLVGIGVATKDDDRKVVLAHSVLTTAPWVIKTFIETFKKHWPDYQLAAQRWYGPDRKTMKLMNYNTNRLIHLLMKGTK